MRGIVGRKLIFRHSCYMKMSGIHERFVDIQIAIAFELKSI